MGTEPTGSEGRVERAEPARPVEPSALPVASSPHDDAMPEGPEPAPRGVRAMAILRWILLAAAALLAIGAWWSLGVGGSRSARGPAEGGESAVRYRCPMHPQIVRDLPGECPICHMTLEPIAADRARSPAPPPPGAVATRIDGGAAVAAFTCPMHPDVREAAPGSCPVCGMGLVAVTPDAGGAALAVAPRARPGEAPPGTAPVTLTLDRIQSIGVRTARVEERSRSEPLRVTAVVAGSDSAVTEVHARTSGFVERIPVGEIGARVQAGQELLALYSPELYQAQAELLAARSWGEAGGDAGSRALASGRLKVELLGMAPRDVDRVLSSGAPLRAVPIYAPRGGVVTKKGAVAGGYVTPDVVLYELLDLSRVYVVADVFQKDVARVRVGMAASFAPRQREVAAVNGKIDLVYPAVGAESRTTRVRLTVPNAAGLLRPGDYGDVTIATGGAAASRALVVPRDAVVDTGTSTYVFVAEAEGRFTPRVVVLGEPDGAFVTVREGVLAGERVVSGATFLVDSESRLQASIAESAAPRPAP
jgi:Cu(I)/Ag(I) efflux system membrane fusion protein